MYILIRNQEMFFMLFLVIYNKMLLKHLWSCVLKLVSELHDFI